MMYTLVYDIHDLEFVGLSVPDIALHNKKTS